MATTPSKLQTVNHNGMELPLGTVEALSSLLESGDFAPSKTNAFFQNRLNAVKEHPELCTPEEISVLFALKDLCVLINTAERDYYTLSWPGSIISAIQNIFHSLFGCETALNTIDDAERFIVHNSSFLDDCRTVLSTQDSKKASSTVKPDPISAVEELLPNNSDQLIVLEKKEAELSARCAEVEAEEREYQATASPLSDLLSEKQISEAISSCMQSFDRPVGEFIDIELEHPALDYFSSSDMRAAFKRLFPLESKDCVSFFGSKALTEAFKSLTSTDERKEPNESPWGNDGSEAKKILAPSISADVALKRAKIAKEKIKNTNSEQLRLIDESFQSCKNVLLLLFPQFINNYRELSNRLAQGTTSFNQQQIYCLAEALKRPKAPVTGHASTTPPRLPEEPIARESQLIAELAKQRK